MPLMIGAWNTLGFYTLLASLRVGHGGRVFAFEPLPRNLAFLRRHVALNGLTNVTVVDAAVTNACGRVRFIEPANSSMGSVSDTGIIEVSAVNLDTLVLERRFPAPDFIKMDIEGGEARALAWARQVPQKHQPAVFLATHGTEIHKECCSLLKDSGYILEALDGRPVDQTDELLATRGDDQAVAEA